MDPTYLKFLSNHVYLTKKNKMAQKAIYNLFFFYSPPLDDRVMSISEVAFSQLNFYLYQISNLSL